MSGYTPDYYGRPTEPAVVVEPTPEKRRGGKGKLVALVTGLVLIVGGGGAAGLAYSKLGGGGAQPEDVVPADAIAFAKVDLDPSAGQKIDAVRFLRKFPAAKAKVSEDADLREVVFRQIQEGGELKGVDYARDVKPWLGNRFGFALLPGATDKAAPIPVVVLAVTDEAKARDGIAKIAKGTKTSCQLAGSYALCGKDRTVVGELARSGGKRSLADAPGFSTDMAAIGEDGIAAAWADLDRVGSAAEAARALTAGPLGLSGPGLGISAPSTPGGGRLAMALRFAGPHLELAGHVSHAPVAFTGGKGGTSVGDLPTDTVAALGIADAGAQVRTGWANLQKAAKDNGAVKQLTDGAAEAQTMLGISIPDDLVKALGSQTTIAFGGMGADRSTIKVALVTDGDRGVLTTIAQHAGDAGLGGALTVTPAGKRSVLSISDDYAQEIATKHGLGATSVFKDAVPDAATAQSVFFVDIAKAIASFSDEVPAKDRAQLAPLSALGLSASGQGTTADFRLRLTTR